MAEPTSGMSAGERAERFSKPCYHSVHAHELDRDACSCRHCEHYRKVREAFRATWRAAVEQRDSEWRVALKPALASAVVPHTPDGCWTYFQDAFIPDLKLAAEKRGREAGPHVKWGVVPQRINEAFAAGREAGIEECTRLRAERESFWKDTLDLAVALSRAAVENERLREENEKLRAAKEEQR